MNNQPQVFRQVDEESFFETFDATPAKGDSHGADLIYCDGYRVVASVRQFNW